LDQGTVCFAFELIGKPLSENPYVSMSLDGLVKASLRLKLRFDLLPIPYGTTIMEHVKANPGFMPKAKFMILKWNERHAADVEWLKEQGYVVVAMGPASSVPGLSYVDIDNVKGGKIAAERLLAVGRSRIAYVDGPLSDVSVQETLAGVEEACLAAGKPFDRKLLRESTPWREETGFAAMESLLSSGIPFDGIVSRGDMASLGAMKALQARGVNVPKELSFVMYEDYPWIQKACSPALTAVKQPFDDMAEAATEIAVASLKNGLRKPLSKIIAPQLVVRDSCVFAPR